MNTEKYTGFSTEDFILDDEFIAWVLHPRQDSDKFWSEFIAHNPEKKNQVKDAFFLVKAMQPVEEDIPAERLEAIVRNIYILHSQQRKRVLRRFLKYAAIGLLLIGTSLFYLLNRKPDPLLMVSADMESADQGKIILSSGASVEFSTRETNIRQTATGRLLVNNDTVDHPFEMKRKNRLALNQVIIPYGKRSEVLLADGTQIWLNAGSQLSYPDEFDKDKREVYLTGEAFFDVVTDPDRPFFVVTKDVKLKVLGTRFNVSAYAEDQTTQAVLVKGRVSVGKNTVFSKAEEILPGESITFNKVNEVFSKEKVDIQYITSWVNGYLVFENEPTPDIFKKLERYYKQTIELKNGLENITFSGKLDLKEDLKDVLDVIAFASSVKVSQEEGKFIIKP